MRLRLIIASVLALVGCAAPGTQAPSQNPQVAVFAAYGAYEVALTVAVAYAELPRCPEAAPVCSRPDVVNHIVSAHSIAHAALEHAQAAVRTPGFGDDALTTAVIAADAAVKAFVSITQTVKGNPL